MVYKVYKEKIKIVGTKEKLNNSATLVILYPGTKKVNPIASDEYN